MARPRVNQFADDLGISRREALNVMNKGRRRSDGGSAVLESNMNKMKGYKDGGSETFSLTEEEELEMMGTNMSTFKKAMHDKAFGGEPMGSGGGRERAMEKKKTRRTMKAKGYSDGGTKLTKEQQGELEALYDTLPRDLDAQANPEGAPQKLPLRAGTRAKSGEKAYENYASGGSMKVKGYANGGSCRGGGAAIKGTKFSGVR
jgi:hypothetical protein